MSNTRPDRPEREQGEIRGSGARCRPHTSSHAAGDVKQPDKETQQDGFEQRREIDGCAEHAVLQRQSGCVRLSFTSKNPLPLQG